MHLISSAYWTPRFGLLHQLLCLRQTSIQFFGTFGTISNSRNWAPRYLNLIVSVGYSPSTCVCQYPSSSQHISKPTANLTCFLLICRSFFVLAAGGSPMNIPNCLSLGANRALVTEINNCASRFRPYKFSARSFFRRFAFLFPWIAESLCYVLQTRFYAFYCLNDSLTVSHDTNPIVFIFYLYYHLRTFRYGYYFGL